MVSNFITTEYGPIPTDWDIKEIKNIADDTKDNSFIDGDWIESEYIEHEGIRLIQTGNIGLGFFKDKSSKKFISEKTFKELKCKEVKEGDILICRLADPIGRSCVVPNLGTKNITSVDVAILRPQNSDYDIFYINYSLNSPKTLNKVSSFASGTTRQRISRKNLGAIRIPVPPIKEQQKIAAILSSVDETIEKTEQIIEQTETVKKGLMQQLLTKGIGHTEFKDTPIGEIPLHWNFVKLEDISEKITKGTTPTTYGFEYVEDGINFIKVESIDDNGNFRPSLFNKITEEAHEKLKRSNILEGDLLISIAGNLGRVAIASSEILPANTNQAISIIRLKEKSINLDFLYYSLKGFAIEKYIKKVSTVGAQPNLSLKQVGEIELPLPNIEEQNKITAVLNSIDLKLKNEISKKRKLSKLKQGLMQQLLTGKVRVKINENEEVPS